MEGESNMIRVRVEDILGKCKAKEDLYNILTK